MTAPETLEELRQAVRDVLATTIPDADGKAQTAEGALHQIAALLPPAPEPIKVGDRVWCTRHDQEGEVRHIEETENGPLYLLRDPVCPSVLWLTGDVESVDSSPPEPESTVCPSCSHHHLGLWWSCPSCGYDARFSDPAPSPSPEVGEGHRVPGDSEVGAAYRANVLEGYDEESGTWILALPWAPGPKRVPSGWAEGRELVRYSQAAVDERTIGGVTVIDWTLDRDGGDGVFLVGGRHFVPAVNGEVWVDPLPKHETETVEPGWSVVDGKLTWNASGDTWWIEADDLRLIWEADDPNVYDDAAHKLTEIVRIHGTVPGYGETGGAS